MSRVVLLGATAAAVVALTACELGPGVRCSSGCPAGTVCDTTSGLCAISGIELVSPADDAGRVRSPVLVRARVRMADPDRAPDALTLRTRLEGGTPEVLSLLRVAPGEYEGTWVEDVDGAYLVEVSGEGLSPLERTIAVDNTPPLLTLQVEENVAAFRSQLPGVEDRDVDFPGAWRRDEVVTVRVTAGEPASDFRWTVQGPTGGGAAGPDASAEQTITETCPATANCRRGRVDLSVPEFKTYRGAITVTARVTDLVGNTAEQTLQIDVTRFRWKRAWSAIAGAPAVGAGGVIYVPVAANPPVVFSVLPDGRQAGEWRFPGYTLEAGLVVHPWGDAGTEHVFVGAFHAQSDAGTLLAFGPGTPAPADVCGPLPGHLAPQMAIAKGQFAQAGGDPSFALIATLKSGALVGATGPNEPCVVSSTAPGVPGANHALTVVDDTLHYSTATQLAVWKFDGGSFANQQSLAPALVAPALAYRPSSSPHPLVGAGRYASDAGAILSTTRGLNGGTVVVTHQVAAPSASSALDDDVLVFGAGPGQLLRVDTKARTVVSVPATAIDDAPLIGNDGRLYVSTDDGRVAVYDTDLVPQWDGVVLSGQAGPLLFDCGRDGGTPLKDRPGTLLVPGMDGTLYAVIVDSTELANSPLPRWQHDSRNSGRALQRAECQ